MASRKTRVEGFVDLGLSRMTSYKTNPKYKSYIDKIMEASKAFYAETDEQFLLLVVMGQIDPEIIRGANSKWAFDSDHGVNDDHTFGAVYDPANLPIIKGRNYFRCNLCEYIEIRDKPKILSYGWRKALDRKLRYGSASYACSRCKYGVSTQIDPKNFAFIEPPVAQPNNDFISKIKKSIVLVIGAFDAERISLASKSYQWPFAPNRSCCQGLILEPGIIAGYQYNLCGCFNQSFEHKVPFAYAMFDNHGQYKMIYGAPFHEDGKQKAPVVDASTNAVLLSASKKDTEHRVPRYRVTELQAGEPVYTVGINRGIWTVTAGEFIKMDGKTIVTNCNVYHGSCGAPLFDLEGQLIGWGATLPHHQSDGISQRKYDVGNFLHISELRKHLKSVRSNIAPAQVDAHP